MIFLIDPSDLTTLQTCLPKCAAYKPPCLMKPLYAVII